MPPSAGCITFFVQYFVLKYTKTVYFPALKQFKCEYIFHKVAELQEILPFIQIYTYFGPLLTYGSACSIEF